MKVSLNWLRQYIDTKALTPAEIGDILTGIGLEVEGMDEVETIPGGLRGLVVGEVKECGKHPNADKLSLTKVDVGGDELLSIVCGAPNVAAGQKVVVATVGTELHPVEGDSFKIKKGKIRGEASEGMLCAEDEIGIGRSHTGIIELPAETKVGSEVRDFYGVETDYIYEIGLTPNRSDATNHLGVAYDLAAALRVNHGHDGSVNAPEVNNFTIDNTKHGIAVEVRNTEACPRYAGVVITGLQVGESPDWLKARLNAVDVRPINNVVDITNFILHELGQPLHAFDLREVHGGIIVDTLPQGTKFQTLDEVERELHAEDLMICDANGKGMCIGGVFGGMKSGVKDDTTAIFLESAHFDAQTIRRTSMRHTLRTDAAKVFEKGSDPNVAVYALKRAAQMIQELAGGKVSSEVVDIYPVEKQPARIEVRYQRVNELIGITIAPKQIHGILEATGMTIVSKNDATFTVDVPTNKSDVLREVDVIEEILRIYGFNNVPIPSRVTTSMAVGQHPSTTYVRNLVSDQLAAQGFNEMMGMSLSESRYYAAGHTEVETEVLVYVNNTSNVHLDIMRPHMVYTGLEAILHNQNRQESDLRLFEFGRTYRRVDAENIEETNCLTLFLTGRRQPESWLASGEEAVNFYTLKTYVNNIMTRLGIQGYQHETLEGVGEFAFALRYFRGPKELVRFGRLHNKLTQQLDLKGEVYYAAFNWDHVFKALPKKRVQFVELSKYPTMRRDLALVVDNSVKFGDIAAIAGKTAKKLLREVNLFDVYTNAEQLGENKKSYAVSFIFADPSRTLKVKEIDKVMQKIITTCETQLNALIRR